MPERATVEIRKDRVYIDVLQNARGHHAVPSYVLRAVPKATISMPLRWDEVKSGPQDPNADDRHCQWQFSVCCQFDSGIPRLHWQRSSWIKEFGASPGPR